MKLFENNIVWKAPSWKHWNALAYSLIVTKLAMNIDTFDILIIHMHTFPSNFIICMR